MDFDCEKTFCSFHPWEEVVGICASCLRERLCGLKGNDNDHLQSLHSFESLYSPSVSDSCILEFGDRSHHKYNFVPRESRPNIFVTRNFLCLPKSNKSRTKRSDQHVEKRRSYWLRSVFDRLKSLFHSRERNKNVKTRQDNCPIQGNKHQRIPHNTMERCKNRRPRGPNVNQFGLD